jgi:putative aldouronate transport system substrate-binding protein
MKRKKGIAVLLVLSMLLSLAACSKGSDEDTSGNITGSTTEGFYVPEAEGGKTTDQFTILAGWTSESPNDTKVQQVMKEQLGIDYQVEYMQSSDYMTTLNLKLSSNANLPDILIFPYDKTVENALITADRIMNLNDVYTSEKLTNIPGIDSRIQDYIKTTDGNKWWIPGYYALEYDDPWPGWTVDAWWVRTDLLEQAGKTKEDLTTIEGLEDTLRSFATLKDSNGNNIIPLSFASSNTESMKHEERIILSTFGVDTSRGVSGMPAVMDINGEKVFEYDNPNYKTAYQWINKIYREGLIDMEATTMSQERFKEKVESGQVGMFTTDLWNSGLNETWKNYDSGADSVTFYYEPIADPTVAGVESGYTGYTNPNPGFMVFINKDTKHLNAALNFLEWVNEPSPYKGQEVNEGPEGILWHFTDKDTGSWDFEESYKVERDSGDSARVAACTHQLWQFASYSNQWYAWWNQDSSGNKAGAGLVSKWCKYISSELDNNRTISDMDTVKVDTESVIATNLESLNNVVDEYTAKLIMADSDQKFEDVYTEFQKQLELRAHWSDMKEEWNRLYQEQSTSK